MEFTKVLGLSIILTLGMFAGILINMSMEGELINLTCPQVNITIPQAVCNCPEPEIIQKTIVKTTKIYTSHFQEVITACHIEREYEATKWDCDVIAKECVSRLQNAGYNCYVKYGKYNKGTEEFKDYENHAWINCGNNLIIEATSGQIVPPSEYWRYV